MCLRGFEKTMIKTFPWIILMLWNFLRALQEASPDTKARGGAQKTHPTRGTDHPHPCDHSQSTSLPEPWFPHHRDK